jgi:hypothetical protein
MPIILVTQEVEIRRISVQGQPRQKVHKTSAAPPISTNKMLDMVPGTACYPDNSRSLNRRINVRSYLKNN